MGKSEAKIIVEERRISELMRLLEFKSGIEVRLVMVEDFLNEVVNAGEWNLDSQAVARKIARILDIELAEVRNAESTSPKA